MADVTVTVYTSLPPEEVLVRAVQFFTSEDWRAQSQSNRIATFVGRPKIPILQLMIAVLLTFCFVLPGVLYYIYVIRKTPRFQNIVVTTTPEEKGCQVVLTYPPRAKNLADKFALVLPKHL